MSKLLYLINLNNRQLGKTNDSASTVKCTKEKDFAIAAF